MKSFEIEYRTEECSSIANIPNKHLMELWNIIQLECQNVMISAWILSLVLQSHPQYRHLAEWNITQLECLNVISAWILIVFVLSHPHSSIMNIVH